MKRFGLLLAFALLATGHSWPQPSTQAAIQQLLHKQAEDWNRGDVNAFMTSYENSPATTFVGEKVEYGYATILERYKRVYATPAAMGKLTFSNLAIRILDSNYAAATGNFHLDRTSAGGGNADGIFSLLFKKGHSGWKIILDHSNRTH
ncbi:MAG: nuclear transport factor 2 family protein [Acidobacteriaceae bacterium]